MAFSMSSGDFTYNRFDLYEGKDKKECKKCDGECKCDKEEKKDDKKKGGSKPDYLDMDKDGNEEESMKDAIEDAGAVSEEVEHLEERLDEMPAGDVGHEIHKKAMKANQSAVDAVNKPKKKSGRPNLADVYGADKRRSKSMKEAYSEVYEALRHRDAKTGEVTDKPEIGKTYYTDGPRAKTSVALRKEKEAAEKKALKKEEFESLEENRRAARAAGGYVDDSKKQTDPSKDGFTGISGSIKEIMKQNKEIEAAKKKATKKEELEATGLFTAEELELVSEALGLGKSEETLEEGASKEELQKRASKGDKEAMKQLHALRAAGKIGKEYGFEPGAKNEEFNLDEDNKIVPGPKSSEHKFKKEADKRTKKAFSLSDDEMKKAKEQRAAMEKKAEEKGKKDSLEKSYKKDSAEPAGAASDYYAKQRKNLEKTFKKEEVDAILEKMSALDMVKKSLPKGALIDTKNQPKRQHWSKEHMRKDVDPKRYDKKND